MTKIVPTKARGLALRGTMGGSGTGSGLPSASGGGSISITRASRNVRVSAKIVSTCVPHRNRFLVSDLLCGNIGMKRGTELVYRARDRPMLRDASRISFAGCVKRLGSIAMRHTNSIHTLIGLRKMRGDPGNHR